LDCELDELAWVNSSLIFSLYFLNNDLLSISSFKIRLNWELKFVVYLICFLQVYHDFTIKSTIQQTNSSGLRFFFPFLKFFFLQLRPSTFDLLWIELYFFFLFIRLFHSHLILLCYQIRSWRPYKNTKRISFYDIGKH
jgi:hypothetical protein